MAKKQEHPQAKWLRAIADGETLQDCNTPMGTYAHVHPHTVLSHIAHGGNIQTLRIKPQTITIGNYEVAEPMEMGPVQGTVYFYLDGLETLGVEDAEWGNDIYDKAVLNNGMCWLNREDAELAAKAISELLTGKST